MPTELLATMYLLSINRKRRFVELLEKGIPPCLFSTLSLFRILGGFAGKLQSYSYLKILAFLK